MSIQDVPAGATPEEEYADEVAGLLWTPFTRWEFVAERENLDEELGPAEPWEHRPWEDRDRPSPGDATDQQ